MNKPNDLSGSVIFPRGGKITDSHFIGAVWVEPLVSVDSTFNCQIANVTFEPGARNNWHKHPGCIVPNVWHLNTLPFRLNLFCCIKIVLHPQKELV